MVDEARIRTALSSLLRVEGIDAAIESIEVEGLRDDPGFHWSNPGLKTLIVTAAGQSYRCVLKTLAAHSRREALVYRFLSRQEGFPVPVLYDSLVDDDAREYWIVLQECEYRHFPREANFWVEVGTLLARIHAPYWGRSDALPALFDIVPAAPTHAAACGALGPVLASLSASEKAIIAEEWGVSLDEAWRAIEESGVASVIQREPLPRCLVHGAFHPPEIMWRSVASVLEPVGVDWENARRGFAGEDLRICTDLLAEGDPVTFDLAIDTYLDTIGELGITVARDDLIDSARHAAIRHRMGVELPWIVPRYLAEREDPGFHEWSRWVRENMPVRIAFMLRELGSELFDSSA